MLMGAAMKGTEVLFHLNLVVGEGGRYRMTYRKTYSEHMSTSRASSPHGPSLQDSVIIPLSGKRIP